MVKTLGVVGAMLAVAHVAWAEQDEIVTYYPSPAAATDDLKVKRAAVGTTYQTLNFDDALAAVADGTLLVEHGLGIGTTTLHNNGIAPSGQPGILDVQDIWLRGANAWASQALADGLEPPKPYRVLIPWPPERRLYNGNGEVPVPMTVSYDLYQALQLWRYGVARNQLRIVRYGMRYYDHTIPRVVHTTAWPAPSTLTTPTIEDGVISFNAVNYEGINYYHTPEVDVTW